MSVLTIEQLIRLRAKIQRRIYNYFADSPAVDWPTLYACNLPLAKAYKMVQDELDRKRNFSLLIVGVPMPFMGRS
jgi:hypothetical protein